MRKIIWKTLLKKPEKVSFRGSEIRQSRGTNTMKKLQNYKNAQMLVFWGQIKPSILALKREWKVLLLRLSKAKNCEMSNQVLFHITLQ